jgi:hypothetical protein
MTTRVMSIDVIAVFVRLYGAEKAKGSGFWPQHPQVWYITRQYPANLHIHP